MKIKKNNGFFSKNSVDFTKIRYITVEPNLQNYP